MFDPQRPDLAIGIVGAGTMGRGIAQLAAMSGLRVRLHDARPGAAAEARAAVAAALDALAAKGRLPPADAAAAAARIEAAAGLEGLAGCHLAVEAIVEDLAAKRSLFAALEGIVGPDCVLATNTSSLSVTAIAAACARPERVTGLHFFNPVPLMRLVEVIPGERTDPALPDRLAALVGRLGHRAVRAADTPGFLVNHAGRGFGTEALRILQEGVADPPTIDRILCEAAGFRMGPFALFDLVGLDVTLPVMEAVFDGFYGEPRFRPTPLLRRRLAAGLLGHKGGGGFHGYVDGRPKLPPEPPPPPAAPRPVWCDPAGGEGLAALVAGSGWPRDEGTTPGPDSLLLLAPLGEDCTTAALRLGVDPARSLAVDTLFGLGGRLTLMRNPATDTTCAAATHALLAAGGRPVSVIADSPGFVAQRVVATIVNIACEIAQQRLAAPADIDAAVRLGLGYPQGPLEWGDALGPARLLAVLTGLHAATGDPRYRPSPWLSRRARLGLSLLREE
ncbi:MAG TPA: 3-hydroxyacyl-CoA dehydrogenase [Alphaproteobacteria bacterium]|nr:3-hydroxyacyl-CoA dehydrogenase [Alphaproteobacteria bacterium]